MGLGGSSIFVKIVEYVHRVVMPDQMLRRVGGLGLGGSSIFVKLSNYKARSDI